MAKHRSPTEDEESAPVRGSIGSWRNFTQLPLTPLLKAALDALYKHGYHGMTVREVASNAGVTMPVLYYHHNNKQGLLVALLEMGMEDILNRSRQAVAEQTGAYEKFVALVECLTLHMTHRFRTARISAELRYLEPETGRRYFELRKRGEELMINVISQGVAEGCFQVSDVRSTAIALLGMIQAITGWFKPNEKLSPAEIAETYIEICLQTVGAEKRGVASKTPSISLQKKTLRQAFATNAPGQFRAKARKGS